MPSLFIQSNKKETKYIILGIVSLIVGLMLLLGITFFPKIHAFLIHKHVLGVSVLLAQEDCGNDCASDSEYDSAYNEGNTASPPSTSKPSQNSGSSASNNTSNGGGNSGKINPSALSVPGVPDYILVDCVGPDGRHFKTSFKDCAAFNIGWGNEIFTYAATTDAVVAPTTPVSCAGPDGKYFQTTFDQCRQYNTKWNNANFTYDVAVPPNGRVDCVGPDGKHFTVTLSECAAFNKKWNNPTFTYTPIDKFSIQNPPIDTFQTALAPSDVITKDGKILDLASQGLFVVFSLAKGTPSAEAVLPTKEKSSLLDSALPTVNMFLQKSNKKIEQKDEKTFLIHTQNVTIKTTYPIYVSLSNQNISVRTQKGEVVALISPEDLLKKLATNNTLTEVKSKSKSVAFSSVRKTIIELPLIAYKNEPVYKIEGFVTKKILGVFSVRVPKTLYISAKNGKNLATEEPIWGQFLEMP